VRRLARALADSARCFRCWLPACSGSDACPDVQPAPACVAAWLAPGFASGARVAVRPRDFTRCSRGYPVKFMLLGASLELRYPDNERGSRARNNLHVNRGERAMFIPAKRICGWFLAFLLTLASTSLSHAQPDASAPGRLDTVLLSQADRSPAPPAPILMPELAPRSRLTISPMVSSALVVNILQLAVAGDFAIQRLDLFGEIRARLAHVFCVDCRGDEGQGFSLGNLRVGARYHLGTGRFRVAARPHRPRTRATTCR
jgi:hypothetical protein